MFCACSAGVALSLGPNGPAPGYRLDEDGILRAVGDNGFCWSPMSYYSGGRYRSRYLVFHTQGINPINMGARAYGFQLRCLSE
ncbi:hypothetical protein [uncultured Rikenella sp.]|uniref:hypothetical protein n=1 Tax=uncultured Rikenella sp. TaxID=368003 RepID=UPI00272BBE5F|nr:hypothetical protein [uncultured Rikenella sp.]